MSNSRICTASGCRENHGDDGDCDPRAITAIEKNTAIPAAVFETHGVKNQ